MHTWSDTHGPILALCETSKSLVLVGYLSIAPRLGTGKLVIIYLDVTVEALCVDSCICNLAKDCKIDVLQAQAPFCAAQYKLEF